MATIQRNNVAIGIAQSLQQIPIPSEPSLSESMPSFQTLPENATKTLKSPTLSFEQSQPDIIEPKVLDIKPDHYYDAGWGQGVPVFKPTMEQFKDFYLFMESVNEYGLKAGIIKIIPPSEWRQALPDLSERIKSLRIKNPITQHILAESEGAPAGTYRQTNVEKRRSFSLKQWREMCDSPTHCTPRPRHAARDSTVAKRGSADQKKTRTSKKRKVEETKDIQTIPISVKTETSVLEKIGLNGNAAEDMTSVIRDNLSTTTFQVNKDFAMDKSCTIPADYPSPVHTSPRNSSSVNTPAIASLRLPSPVSPESNTVQSQNLKMTMMTTIGDVLDSPSEKSSLKNSMAELSNENKTFMDSQKKLVRNPIVEVSSTNCQLMNSVMEVPNEETSLMNCVNVSNSESNMISPEPITKPKPKRTTRRRKPQDAILQEDWTGFDYRIDNASEFTLERCKELERTYWKNITYNQPMYGADLDGSLFDGSTKEWNVAHLDSVLNLLKRAVPGVNTPYLYFGMWKATFPWHVEDMDLYSINYIHFGAPKQWYSVPPPQADRFKMIMASFFPGEAKACSEFLRHKTFHASPSLLATRSIPVYRCVQHEGEFVVTFPFGYHAGYNLGYNCAESVNFALKSWIDIGKKALACKCVGDSVMINVSEMVREGEKGKEGQEGEMVVENPMGEIFGENPMEEIFGENPMGEIARDENMEKMGREIKS